MTDMKLKESAIEGDPTDRKPDKHHDQDAPPDGTPVELDDELRNGLGGPPWKAEQHLEAVTRHMKALARAAGEDQEVAAVWASRLLAFLGDHADAVLTVYKELDAVLADRSPVAATLALMLLSVHGMDQLKIPRGALPTVIHWLPAKGAGNGEG
jgi:hypothetical protein